MAEDTGQQKHHLDERTPKRHNKLPLTLHPTGQYCKKIHGRMYYFGRGREKALKLYHEQATSLPFRGYWDMLMRRWQVSMFRRYPNRPIERSDTRVIGQCGSPEPKMIPNLPVASLAGWYGLASRGLHPFQLKAFLQAGVSDAVAALK